MIKLVPKSGRRNEISEPSTDVRRVELPHSHRDDDVYAASPAKVANRLVNHYKVITA